MRPCLQSRRPSLPFSTQSSALTFWSSGITLDQNTEFSPFLPRRIPTRSPKVTVAPHVCEAVGLAKLARNASQSMLFLKRDAVNVVSVTPPKPFYGLEGFCRDQHLRNLFRVLLKELLQDWAKVMRQRLNLRNQLKRQRPQQEQKHVPHRPL